MKLLICCFLCIIITSCNNDISIEDRIYKDLKSGKKTVIDLKDYSNTDWDKVYIFQSILPHKEINKILNTEYNHYVEFTRPFVFMKANKVVYYENLPTNIEKMTNGQLVYKDLLNKDKFIEIDNKHSKLKAKIVKEGDLEFVLIE